MFDYPAIYKEADNISNKTQKSYLLILKAFLCMLFVSSILFTYFDSILVLKVINATISLVLVVLSFVFQFRNFQGDWYNARAVAESIKTISWRYSIKVEPYNISDGNAKKLFLKTIKHIIDMNHDFKKCIEANYGNQQEIPENMTAIRQLPFNERLNVYHKHRIIEQRDWYIKKSKYNKGRSNLFFCSLIIISIILFVLIGLSFRKIEDNFVFPVSILLSLISVLFTWVQTKKYKELEKSYALTSHEINFIATQKDDVISDDLLSEYVDNSENAFSREHTQWIARKDT
jgi:undecaprenyl pyrophosphate phosphatase UppP